MRGLRTRSSPTTQCCLSALHFAFRQVRAEAQPRKGAASLPSQSHPKSFCDLKRAGSEPEYIKCPSQRELAKIRIF